MVTRSTRVDILGLGVYVGARVTVTDVVATALTVLTDTTVEVDTGEAHVQACGFINLAKAVCGGPPAEPVLIEDV